MRIILVLLSVLLMALQCFMLGWNMHRDALKTRMENLLVTEHCASRDSDTNAVTATQEKCTLSVYQLLLAVR